MTGVVMNLKQYDKNNSWDPVLYVRSSLVVASKE